MMLVSSFVLILTHLYYLYLVLLSNKTENNEKLFEVSVFLIWIANTVIKFFFINYTCAKTISEVFISLKHILVLSLNHIIYNLSNKYLSFKWKRTGKIIHRLELNMQDNKLRNEIQLFSIQMMQNHLKFSPCGLVDLGYSFIRDVSECKMFFE